MGKLIKICGLNTTADVAAARNAGTDLFGLVFFPPSPRSLAVSEAAPLVAEAGASMRSVALVVDPDPALIDEIMSALKPDFIQFHGKERPGRLRAVRDRHPVGIIKAVGVANRDDIAEARTYAPVADIIILDAKAPEGATRPGGHGQVSDWSLIAGFNPGIPWLVSGGLTPKNGAAALAATGADGVDVSSGVETGPGIKDPVLIDRFVAAIRKAEADLAA